MIISLVNYCRFIIEHCLKCYGDKLDHDDIATGIPPYNISMSINIDFHVFTDTEEYYELSEDKVCQFYAELLLRPAGKVIFYFYISIDIFNLL